jgi:hypothetical protein
MNQRFDLDAEISELTREKLKARTDVGDADWSFWERKNLNMHRVVASWRRGGGITDAVGLRESARTAIRRRFRRAWWRGLAFGIAVEVDSIGVPPADLAALVDGRENVQGTWQWVVLVSRDGKALAVHTWIEGYLSPIYVGVLERLRAQGFEVTSARKEKDGLMKLLTAARPGLFPGFREAS